MLKNALLHSRLLLIFVFVVLLLNYFSNDRSLVPKPVRHVIRYIFSPIEKTTTMAKYTVIDFLDSYILLLNLREENELLKVTNAQLTGTINLLKEMEIQNRKFAELLKLSPIIPNTLIHSFVIARSPDNLRYTIRIDKGSKDRVSLNDPVIDHNGAIGVVIAVDWYTSDILLLSDFNCYIDVLVQRTRVHGGIYGKNFSLLQMKYVDLDADVVLGDTIISSGFGQIWPKGIPVGEVTKVVQKENDLFKYLEVKPHVDFKKIEEVMVISRQERTVAK